MHSDTYHVVGVNIAGTGASSNTDVGSSVAAFAAIWSGDSVMDYGGSIVTGIFTSGDLVRYGGYNYDGLQDYSEYSTVTLDGDLGVYTHTTTGVVADSSHGFLFEHNLKHYATTTETVGEVLFTIAGGFSGSSEAVFSELDQLYETSGGQLRYSQEQTYVGDWITLT